MAKTTTKVVDEIGKINISGDIIPPNWLKHITYKTKTGKLKPDLLAIFILANIRYWYTPTIVRDSKTDEIIAINKKFEADKLQKSYNDYVNITGCSKKKVKSSFDLLKKLDLITIEFRNIEIRSGMLYNVMYVEPSPENISKITFSKVDPPPKKRGRVVQISKDIPPKEGVTYSKKGNTYTEITTEITTETTADILSPQAGQDAEIQFPLEDSSKEKEDKTEENVYIFDSNLISMLKKDFVYEWKDYLAFLKKMVRKELETGILIRYTDKWISQIYIDFHNEYGETGVINGLTQLKKQCDGGVFPYYTKRLLLQFIIRNYSPKVELFDGHIKYTCACHYIIDLENESICPKCHSAINEKYIDTYLEAQTAV